MTVSRQITSQQLSSLEVDREAIDLALADLLLIPAGTRRAAALADFVEIDPALGQRLALELTFTLS